MKLRVEVDTTRPQDARMIAKALARWIELERAGEAVDVVVTTGPNRRKLARLVSPAALDPLD